DAEHLLRDRAVLVEVGMHDDQRWTQPDRSRHRERRPDAKCSRLVAGGGDDAALVGIAADGDREAAKRRVVALLDRGVERIHIDMEDAADTKWHRSICRV